MAKSLRSKWKRKMRAVKRVRYGQKELDRLKKTVGQEGIKKEIDEIITDASDIVTVTDQKAISTTSATNSKIQSTETTSEKMDDDTVPHKYNTKTMKDQYGSYPVWVHQRKISKKKKARKGRPKTR